MTSDDGKKFDETLLTAYLDDELTPEERELVEQQLNSSESTRRLLEDLRSVRAMVRQLHSVHPLRTFENAPWNSKADATPMQAVVPAQSANAAPWHWRQWASLAALFLVTLTAGGLWWSSQLERDARIGFFRSEEKTTKDTRELPGLSLDDTETSYRAKLPSKNVDSVTDSPRFDDFSDVDAKEKTGRSAASDAIEPPAPRTEPLSFSIERPLQRPAGEDAMDSSAGKGAAANALSGAPSNMPSDAPSNGREASMPTSAWQRLGKQDPSKREAAEPMDKKANLDATSLGAEVGTLTDKYAKDGISNGLMEWEYLVDLAKVDTSDPNRVEEAKAFFMQKMQDSDFVPLADSSRWAGVETDSVAVGTYYFGMGLSSTDTNANAAKFGVSKRDIAVPDSGGIALETNKQEDLVQADRIYDTWLIDVEIPSERWEEGAKALRKLGVPVPTEMPSSSTLDYIAAAEFANVEPELPKEPNIDAVDGRWQLVESKQKSIRSRGGANISSGGLGGRGSTGGSVGGAASVKPSVVHVRLRIPSSSSPKPPPSEAVKPAQP